MEFATLGGGCFWCLEAVYQQMKGVTAIVSGYSGGHVANPTYQQVCGGRTGHAEVVRLSFDSERVSYRDILEVFFAVHDPTTPDRQGNDVGPQYRSVIFYHSEEQRRTAEQVMREMASCFDDPIVTELLPAPEFYEAEAYHQDYFRRNPNQPYCAYVIAPKLAKYRKKFSSNAAGV